MQKLILLQNNIHILKVNQENVGRDSAVGRANPCGLDSPGIESLWG